MERPTNSSKFKRARKGRGHTSSVSNYLASILLPESLKYNNTNPRQCDFPILLLYPQVLFHTRRTGSQSIGQNKNGGFLLITALNQVYCKTPIRCFTTFILKLIFCPNFNRSKRLCGYLGGQIWSSMSLFFKFSPSLKTAQ